MREVFRLPDVGEGIAEAEIVEYLVQVGDKVKADQPVIRVETDKAVVELPAPFSGTVAEIPHKPGDTVRVGDPLIIIETDVAARPAAPPKEAPPPPAEREAPEAVKPVPSARPPERVVPIAAKAAEAIEREPGKRVLATPHTRRLARELGIDIATVIGSGRGGRITDDDVRETVGKAAPPPPRRRPPRLWWRRLPRALISRSTARPVASRSRECTSGPRRSWRALGLPCPMCRILMKRMSPSCSKWSGRSVHMRRSAK